MSRFPTFKEIATNKISDLTGIDIAGQSAGESISQGLEKISGVLGLEQGAAGDFRSTIFPNSLVEQTGIRPVVLFFCQGGKGHLSGSLVLPAPSSFGNADTAQYGSTELGFGGKLAMDFVKSATTSEGRAQIGSQFDNLVGKGKSLLNRRKEDDFNQTQTIKDLAKAAAPTLALKKAAELNEQGEGIGKGIAMAIGVTFNKNVTTEFTSVSTRSFSFSYDLIPSTQEEGEAIHRMVTAFRQGVYPSKAEGTFGQILRYPPKWNIRFLNSLSGNSERPPGFPALAECYLTSFTTTYNGNNSFHVDGRPVQTNIQFTFQEDRSLTLEDINELEETGEISSGIIGS